MTPNWRTSTYSGGNGCIEVAQPDSAVHVRDSKQTDGPVLTFDPGAWAAFIDAVKGAGL